MKIIITQPNYLPWLGYFAQLNATDMWVVLDDVQYSRREWQNRNRVLCKTGHVKFLTLPLKKASRATHINEMLISNSFTPEAHLRILREEYNDSACFDSIYSLLLNTFAESFLESNSFLANYNVSLVNSICKAVGIEYDLRYSSAIPRSLDYSSATERLVAISKYYGASTYLSSQGARNYMQNEVDLFSKNGIELCWQDFHCFSYPQKNSLDGFVSHLSVVDYFFNAGVDGFTSNLAEAHKEVSDAEWSDKLSGSVDSSADRGV
jgi:hypothetical protein